MSEEKKEEKINKGLKSESKFDRKIIIETDGNSARITRADVAGKLELKSILQELLNIIK